MDLKLHVSADMKIKLWDEIKRCMLVVVYLIFIKRTGIGRV